MNYPIKYILQFIIILTLTISCASNLPNLTSYENNSNLYQKPTFEYKLNKIPTRINIIVIESSKFNTTENIFEGFIDNYFSKQNLDGLETKFLRIKLNELNKINCKKFIKDSDYSIIIDTLDQDSIVKKECLVQLSKGKGLFISFYAPTTIKQRTMHQISFDLKEDMLRLLSLARRENSVNSVVIKNQFQKNDLTLENLWEDLEGKVINSNILDSNESYETLISKSLSLSESDKRMKQLEYITSIKLGFIPRKRKDIDTIIIYTNMNEARVIKPAIEYNFAGDLNVYFLNTEKFNYKSNINKKDFEGIIFLEYPINILNYEQRSLTSRGMMYGLGFDAFELFLLLNHPSSKRKFTYYGLTGEFLIKNNLKIKRQSSLIKVFEEKFKKLELSM